MGSAGLEQRSVNFFCKGQKSKYSRLCRPRDKTEDIVQVLKQHPLPSGPFRVLISFAPMCPQLEAFSEQRATGPGVGKAAAITVSWITVGPCLLPAAQVNTTWEDSQNRGYSATEIPKQIFHHLVPCICHSGHPNESVVMKTGPSAIRSEGVLQLWFAAHCASPPCFQNRLSSKGRLAKTFAQ